MSSGAFVTAGLANGISPREMHAMLILDRSRHDPFEPELLLRPAFGEFARRPMRLPELMQAAAFAYFGEPFTVGLVESFMRLTRGLPNGLFDNDGIASYEQPDEQRAVGEVRLSARAARCRASQGGAKRPIAREAAFRFHTRSPTDREARHAP